ncbi:MAG TPA: ribosome-associated translation inhibitor RaiA [Actinotalea caeni]|uniref:ribosome hibernation-promoting factor, HPF/YfiA family n=1 Tax=Actinotalea caeni TaxID=1348467 RepID=UPI0012E2264F|nr:ribosome-associated translation inhibitor RaiA [Actinotalea caeni]HLV54281.1 ribosome-associated translation inhibitor RaiA [Actinotalea caeni]
MDIVVVGRHTEVPERFRRHIEGKLAKVEQLSPYAQRVDVEITHEANPRMADQAERVELTVRARGPVVRAEASASDRYAALDLAMAKLLERLRRSQSRRRSRHRGNGHAPAPVPADLGTLEVAVEEEHQEPLAPGVAVEQQLGDSPVVIRQKVHDTSPMTVDDAVAEMELVGHPFYLFIEAESHQPAVVYRRQGWTYGVIRLNATTQTEQTEQAEQAAS